MTLFDSQVFASECCCVWTNGYIPFGESKARGIECEGTGHSIDEMREKRTIVFDTEV
ncbi:MAG: hypothetical protein ACE5IJ_12175 [Thermoplasmata archaeon]